MHTPKTVSIGGTKLALDREVMSDHMIEVLRSGKYERAEVREIKRIVQPGDRIVELGAGLGFIAITATKLNIAKSVAVYEANPRLIPLITQNQHLNGVAFEVFNQVVLPTNDLTSVPFYIRQDFWSSSLAPEPWGHVAQVDVPTTSFQDMLDRHRPTLLISDIEGGELDLFRTVPLTGIKKVLIELHQNVIGRVGMKQVFDYFSSRDFHYDQHHSHGSVVLFSHVLR